MATLTQTAQGDLTSFIAGKIFERVKESLDNREIPKGSPEVEKAAKELVEKQEVDTDSVPVVDEKLRNQVNKLFGTRLEVKLVQLEGKVEKTNAAIKTIGAGITDTQELIVNQNQILEDKFDKLLDVIGTSKEIKDKNAEKLKADKESADIMDQTKMFDSEALARTLESQYGGSSGLLGFLLRRTLGRAGKKLLTKATRKFIPRNIRSRGRLFRSGVDAAKRNTSRAVKAGIARALASGQIKKDIGTRVARRLTNKVTTPLVENLLKKRAIKSGGKIAAKKIPGLGAVVGGAFAIERLIKGDVEGAGLELLSGLLGAIPTVGTGASFAVDAYIIRRDVESELRGEYGYAAGTERTKKGAATLHGTELILGKKDINDISLGFKNAIGLIGSVLTSVSLDVASAAGAEHEVRSLITDEGLGGFDKSIKYTSDLGKVRTNNVDVKAIDAIAALNLPFLKRDEEQVDEVEKKSGGKWYKPWTWGRRKGGSGSVPSVEMQLNSLIDKTGEPGVDFTPTGINNRALFDGEVVELGYQYNKEKQRGYGHYVVVRSEDPKNGEQFDALYAHIPKNAIYVNKGDQVKVGDRIGRMGTEDDDREDVGSIDGTHMSVDFLKVGSSEPYPHWRTHIVPLVDTKFGAVKLKKQDVNPDLKSTTIEMLTRYENFEPNAYDDGTGVWTVGYGATMIRGKDSGIMRPVREGDTVTKEEAKLMKRRDYWEHYDRAEKDLNSVGLSLQDLPVRVAAPLVSVAFNYGNLYDAHRGTPTPFPVRGKLVKFPKSLPEMVKEAYNSGDYTAVADLFEFNLSGDKHGQDVRPEGTFRRRQSEAQIIRSGTDDDNYYELQNLDLPMSFFPNRNKNLLNAKLDSDSREVEELFEKIANAGQPIIVLNTQVIAKGSDTIDISKIGRKIDWKDQYRIASLG